MSEPTTPPTPPWITADVAARQLQLGEITEDDKTFLEWWIAAVVGSLTDLRPNLAQHIERRRLSRASVEGVIITVLGRILSALDIGIGMRSEDHPEYRMQAEPGLSAGDFIRESDLRRLTPRPLATARSSIYSVPLGAQPGPYSRS